MSEQKCEHRNIVFIPIGRVSREQSDGEWCADCGRLLLIENGEKIHDYSIGAFRGKT
jgi:hypothetical protein